MTRPCSILIAVFLYISYLPAQVDSTRQKSEVTFFKKSALPASLIITGVLLSDSRLERRLNQNIQERVGDNFQTNLDDYMRFAPVAQLYIADIAGVKAKNHWFDQTKNMALSILLTDLLTKGLKKNIHKMRPNGFNAESLPSGHTSIAFSTASVLYEEFKDTSPLLAYSGYGFATTTGALRMAKNKHWLSDVLFGAGIGVMVSKLVYHFDYLFPWNPFTRYKDVILLPSHMEGVTGVYLSVKF
ncbi:phosphatase PAP2 family protein [Flavobacteriaceae bacterium 3-367]|uniref:phosphatase PAP2 family protein n=1 Tax=Eudoraea algarum TaxID=3417568 RepID=UPI00326DAD2B